MIPDVRTHDAPCGFSICISESSAFHPCERYAPSAPNPDFGKQAETF